MNPHQPPNKRRQARHHSNRAAADSSQTGPGSDRHASAEIQPAEQAEKRQLRVVCALIHDAKGDLLICQRQPGGSCGNLWEFPGGKIEAGEKPEEALIRECCEELAVTIEPKGYYGNIRHEYPDVLVDLSFFYAAITAGVPRKIVHQAIRWVSPAELGNYSFCPADEPVLRHLQRKL